MAKMRNILIILILLITSNVNAQDRDSVFQDSVTLRGKVVSFEDKKPLSSLIIIYKDFEVDPNERLADVEIKDSYVAYTSADENGDFEIRLAQGDYVMFISSFFASKIVKRISLTDSIVELGIFDIFSLYGTLDEPSADRELRKRVYRRIMTYRREGNPTKYNIVNEEEIESEIKSNKIHYEDYKLGIESFNEKHKTNDTAQVKGMVLDAYDEIDITTSKVIFSNYSDNFADSIANKISIETPVNANGEFSCSLPYGYYVCTIVDPTGKYDVNKFTVEVSQKQLDMGYKYIDPEAKTKYLSGATILVRYETIGWKEDKRRLQRYNAKMEKKYSRIEESSYTELLKKENL